MLKTIAGITPLPPFSFRVTPAQTTHLFSFQSLSRTFFSQTPPLPNLFPPPYSPSLSLSLIVDKLSTRSVVNYPTELSHGNMQIFRIGGFPKKKLLQFFCRTWNNAKVMPDTFFDTEIPSSISLPKANVSSIRVLSSPFAHHSRHPRSGSAICSRFLMSSRSIISVLFCP